jgi:serine/threonine protein kinase
MEVKEKINLIGQGTFGCSYHPPLSCKEEELNNKYGNDKYIMKIATKEDIQDDIKISPLLQKIDPIQQYFLYVIPEKCSLKIPIEYLKDKCIIVQKNPDKQFNGYFIKYGGITLQQYIKKYPEKITINRVWGWLIKLIYSISLLQKHQICHLDIKADNIVIDDLDNIYLIDFGLTVQITDEVKRNYTSEFIGFYPIYPLFYNVATSATLEQLSKEYKDRLTDKQSLFKDYLHLSATNEDKYWRTVIIPNIYKVDVYSLGRQFLYNIYIDFRDTFKKENEQLANQLKVLVMSMTVPDYKEQFDINQCLDYINKLNIEEKLGTSITRLSEIYISDEGKKKALNKLCKLSKDAPKDDLIVYYDKNDKIYYCLSKDELLKMKPYYINPQNPLKFIDYNFIDKIKDHYKLQN